MATCEVADSGSDQITQVCNLCCKNVSDGYCVECEDYMCQSCFDIHTRARACRHHVLIDDINHPNFNKKTFSKPCEQHPELNVEFYCVNHKCVGCVRCFFLEHKICTSESIDDAARRFKTRGEDKRLMDELQNLEDTYDKYTKQNEIDSETAATVNEKTVKDMNSFADRIISCTEKFKRDMLERSERLLRENETRLEKRLAELDCVGNEIETFKVKLENKDNLEKLFIESTEISPSIKRLKQKMTSFGQQVTTEYEFRPNKQILDILNESKCFGKICIMSDDEHLNRNTGLATAVNHIEDPPFAKNKGKFTLKPVQQGKTYLIQSDACSKLFEYTPKSVDVCSDDDDDLLFDGDNIYKLIVDNGTIKLDALPDAKIVNSTESTMNPPGSQSSPNKTNEFEQVEDNKAHVHDCDADIKSGPAKDDAMEGITNSLTPAEAGCEPSKLSNKNIFCLSGAERNNIPKICVQTFNPRQPSKVTLYSFGCKNMSVFLKWTFALRNKSILKQISMKYNNVVINGPDDVLAIEDPDRKYCSDETLFDFASSVVDCIIGITKIYKCEGISLDGYDASTILSAIQQLQVSRYQLIVEYYNKDEDIIWVLFHSSQRKQLMDAIEKARVQCKSTEVQFVETLTLAFFWHKILSEKQFVDDFEKSHKTVTIKHEMIEDNDSVIVTVRSDCKEDAKAAHDWIYSTESDYVSAFISYKDLNVPSNFETSVVMDEFLRRSFEGKGVKYAKNEKTHNIWIWSESMGQGDLDKERNKVKSCIKKNEVIKTLSSHKSKRFTTVTEKLAFSEDSALVKISYEDGNVKITGLCQIVDQIRCEIEKGSYSGSDLPAPPQRAWFPPKPKTKD